MFHIARDGFYFRVINHDTGYQSPALTSASQAGLLIERKAGKEAHRDAAIEFLHNPWLC